MAASVHGVLDAALFQVGGSTVTVGTIFTVLVIVAVTVVLSKLLQRGVRQAFARRGVDRESTVGTVSGVLNYIVLLIGFAVAIQAAGIDIGALFAAGALFAVGLAFAMQNIAQNFVSGIILLVERVIRPGDVLEVENTLVKVMHIGIRATIVRTRDGEDMILPNSALVQSSVTNFTYNDPSYRIWAQVGVVYSSDMQLVDETLRTVARGFTWRDESREPTVFMNEFGNHSVNFDVGVWMKEPWESRPRRAELNTKIWWALKEKGIVIAFPQLDVHLDPNVTDSLVKLAASPSIAPRT